MIYTQHAQQILNPNRKSTNLLGRDYIAYKSKRGNDVYLLTLCSQIPDHWVIRNLRTNKQHSLNMSLTNIVLMYPDNCRGDA